MVKMKNFVLHKLSFLKKGEWEIGPCSKLFCPFFFIVNTFKLFLIRWFYRCKKKEAIKIVRKIEQDYLLGYVSGVLPFKNVLICLTAE